MNRLLLVAAAMFGLGCGGSYWEGTYSGTFSYTETCSDGTGSTDAQPTQWRLNQNGGIVTISPMDSTCGSFTADLEGSSAVLQPKACPPYAGTDGFMYYPVLTSGSLSLNGDHLTGSESYVTDFSGSWDGTCNGIASIDMQRI